MSKIELKIRENMESINNGIGFTIDLFCQYVLHIVKNKKGKYELTVDDYCEAQKLNSGEPLEVHEGTFSEIIEMVNEKFWGAQEEARKWYENPTW